MAETDRRRTFKVQIFSDDRKLREKVATALSALSHYVAEGHDVSALINASADVLMADVVLLDIAGGKLLGTEPLHAARRRFARTPLILITDSVETDRVRDIMRLDAQDLLVKPLDNRKLTEAVEAQLGTNRAGLSRAYAIVSATGGSGGSSLAIAMADAINGEADADKRNTCLVDLDFSSASCGLYLGVTSDYDLSEIVDDPNRIDAEFMDIIRKETPDGLSVFSFDYKMLPFQPKASELVLRMLDVLAFQYKNVVIDLPYWEAPWKTPILETVNDIFIASTFSIPALKQARDLYNTISRARGGRDNITMVVNRYRRRLFSNTLSKKELRKVFKERPISFIRDDHEVLIEAINRGVVVKEVNARSGFVKDTRLLLADHRRRNNAGNFQT